MSWASRKRTLYTIGVLVFFAIVLGVPTAIWWYESPTCFDKKQNQGETTIDRGGPCVLLDERTLSPYGVLWARAFLIRPGSYNAVAYVENPNRDAGARTIGYRFRLYDERNVVVAEREGKGFIMPGGVTPFLEGAISTGNRNVARTFFEFTEPPIWERLVDNASVLSISNKTVSVPESTPRITARAKNTSVVAVLDPSFVAVAFDTAGNAFAASHTTLPRLGAGEEVEVVFTWFSPFLRVAGRVDVLPLLPPTVGRK
ncbi:hypothetical protein A3A39_03735 [Candidatus Kaiserbacteria bacterium RIFCSPLOWO2_01_FULL_54_13]|uniref:Uncharacterized protein n=1 Tax=Candidatus Kaiserbacteria bacterium RIFCSPLOWO2_01_FULL_54_13 TaxID=1798512 RepID=A0A1F6F334_9BACT|nr:MAG: hypothetical protein A3A39_03735 [Candidatus Kaiserbacteria bacterium RIFCSPLOWO2_01_FULL_54_13]